MADFKQIDKARRVLGLGESATIAEIREAYRKLALKCHPDKRGDDKKRSEEEFKRINNANEVLMTYVSSYRFSFEEEKAGETDMDRETYEHMKRFYDGWWGGLDT